MLRKEDKKGKLGEQKSQEKPKVQTKRYSKACPLNQH